jgi:sigma-B regulation protein RsbU (phosphoserine phosphatase)
MTNGTHQPRTLIADDQPDVLEALRLLLRREGYQIEAVNSPRAVLDSLASREYDLLLMDLNYARDTTSGQEGLDLLARIQDLDSSLPVVVMTAWGSIPLAVEAMRRGAKDFVQKPWENAQLLSTLRNQIRWREAARDGGDEIEEARQTQQALLPRRLPRIPGCDIAVSWTPARAVSGDYLDVLKLAGNRLALCIGDVVGKGMPAALLMSNLQASVRALAPESIAPRELAGRVNRLVCANTGNSKFITFFYGVLDEHKTLTYTNAGHCVPILVRAGGDALRLDCGGVVLGVFPEWSYTQAQVQLAPGDRLVLFTDGITEAENDVGDQFGDDRLLELVACSRHLDAAALRGRVTAAVGDFAGGRLTDDATVVVMAVA